MLKQKSSAISSRNYCCEKNYKNIILANYNDLQFVNVK